MPQTRSTLQLFKFENITEADISLISEGLGELPWKKVNPLIQKLQMQINIQEQDKLLEEQQEAAANLQKYAEDQATLQSADEYQDDSPTSMPEKSYLPSVPNDIE